VISDLRYAVRSFAKTPLFTAIVLLTLALGIGANTAMFSVISAVLLEPLPYPRADALMRVRRGSSWPDMRDWAAQAQTVAVVAGYRPQLFDYDAGDVPDRTDGALVTGRLFELLGGRAIAGRLVDDRDEVAGAAHVAVISERFWRSRVGSDRRVVGRTMSFNGSSYQVIGVLDSRFELPGDKADVFAAFYPEATLEAESRGAHTMRGLVSLKPGISPRAAQADMDGVAVRLEQAYPRTNLNVRFRLLPLADSLVGPMKSALLVLLATVVFVLMIACVNVANLLIARAAARRGEMAVRVALGASGGRIARQLAVESLILAAGGGALGLRLAWWLARVVVALAPETLPRLDRVAIDGRVLLFALGASMLAALVFGVLPAWIGSRSGLADATRGHGHGSSGRPRLRTTLMAAEIALALMLVCGAGVLLRSFSTLLAQPVGFATDHVLTGNIKFSSQRYRDIATRTRFFDDLERTVSAMPGVKAVGFVTELPLGGEALMHNLAFEGRAMAPGAEPEVYYRGINAGYFKALGIPVTHGRAIAPQDTATSPLVAVANDAFARQFYAGADVVGRRVRWASGTGDWITIVGVVPDVRGLSLDQGEVPALYVSYAQEQSWWRMWMDVVVRTGGEPAAFAPDLRRAVAQVDRSIPIARVRTMDDIVKTSVSDQRFNLFLVGAFASLALLLAAAGTYGVMAYLVTQRSRELGIRVAVGATGAQIMRLVLGHALAVATAGAAIGLAGWWAVARLLQGFLFGVTAMDVRAVAGAILILLLMTLAACYAPARRAARIDPLIVLRSE
jgi:putative ABC transport system permease protein